MGDHQKPSFYLISGAGINLVNDSPLVGILTLRLETKNRDPAQTQNIDMLLNRGTAEALISDLQQFLIQDRESSRKTEEESPH